MLGLQLDNACMHAPSTIFLDFHYEETLMIFLDFHYEESLMIFTRVYLCSSDISVMWYCISSEIKASYSFKLPTCNASFDRAMLVVATG